MEIKFSKSKIKQFIQCEKQLWLQTYKPEVAYFSPEKLKTFKNGNKVGDYARLVYPNGNLVKARKNIKKVEETLELLEKKEVIFEASFVYNNTICQVDVLRPVFKDNIFIGWDVIECKAGTSAKEEYIEDIAIQYYIITSAKTIPINKFYIWHINKEATGESDLFKEVEIEEKLIPYIHKYDDLIKSCNSIIEQKEEPTKKLGVHCDTPYECSFKKYCWKNIPLNKKTIFDIPSFSKKWHAFNEGIVEINKENLEKLIKLGAREEILKSIVDNKMFVDEEKIKDFFKDLVFPLSALDFESMQYVIPPFEKVRPYEQIPFQYSLKILQEDGKYSSHSFLHQNNTDPRKILVEDLVSNIPNKGHILSYNMTFEKMILRKLGELYPEYMDKINNIILRMIDPLPLIEKALYHPDFGNSYSIKNVAPALFGQKGDYSKLEVQNGQDAQEMYLELTKTEDIFKRIEINQKMRDYCDLDVYNLILIVEKLMILGKVNEDFKIIDE